MKILNGIRIVFERKKYLTLFISMTIIFSFVYLFAWNLILIPNLYVRIDLWTLSNILPLVFISILSGLAITLSVFNFKMKMIAVKGGFFAIIPAFFTSACPGCAPLILSFTSTASIIGLSIAQLGFVIKIFTILVLSATVLYISKTIYKCEIKIKKK